MMVDPTEMVIYHFHRPKKILWSINYDRKVPPFLLTVSESSGCYYGMKCMTSHWIVSSMHHA